VPAGVTLTKSGDVIVTQDGAVISGLDIRGTVYIKASNVTLMNCKITSNDYAVVNIASNATGVVVKDCTIDGTGSTFDGAGNQGIMGNGTFLRNNISNVENGITIQDNNTVIEGNYIHDLQAAGAPHYDGIQIDGGISNVKISQNTIINDHGSAGAIMIDNYFGAIKNISVDNNLLAGGSFTIYSDGSFNSNPITGVTITNNHISPGQYGSTYFKSNSPTYTGNAEDGAALVKGLTTVGQPPGTGTGTTEPPPATTTPDAPKLASFSHDSGVAGDGITYDNTLTVTGSAAANSAIKIMDAGKQIGTATANSSGAWSYTTGVLADGNHSLTATATTASGKTSTASSALAIKIDTAAPVAPTITSSAMAAAIAEKAAAATSTATNVASLKGTAEANSVVKVFDGTTQIGTATADAKGAWSFTTSPLSAGKHSLTSKAMDSAGNTGVASKAVVVNVPSDSGNPGTPGTPGTPTVPKIGSMSNDTGVKGDGITSDNTLTLTGSAAANSVVKVFDGAKAVGTATANSSGAWTFTTAALADGVHNLTAKTVDKAGKMSDASAVLAAKIDTHAPDAPKIASVSSDGNKIADKGVAGSDHVTLTGTAEANSTVSIFDGNKQVGTATANDKGAWNYAADSLADGNHSFTSKAMDAAGNLSKASAALNVKVDAHDDAHGADSVFNGMYQKWNDSVWFKGTADPFSQITIYDNGKASGIATAKAGDDGAWSVSTKSAVSDAVHTFTMKVKDGSGHVTAGEGSAVLGTNRADTIKSTSGNDLLKGNGGHDTFVFAPNFGKDVITDFQASGRGHDVVQISKSVFDSFADVLSHASQSGHDVVINAGGVHTLTLKDTKMAALDKTDFHFA
jgi:hypothetical protein